MMIYTVFPKTFLHSAKKTLQYNADTFCIFFMYVLYVMC